MQKWPFITEIKRVSANICIKKKKKASASDSCLDLTDYLKLIFDVFTVFWKNKPLGDARLPDYTCLHFIHFTAFVTLQ